LLSFVGCAYINGSKELEDAHRVIAEQKAAQEQADRDREAAAQAGAAAFWTKRREEEVQRDAVQRGAVECRAPWDASSIAEAARARVSDMSIQADVVPAKPSQLFHRFRNFVETDVPRLDAARCDVEFRAELEREWEYLQQREAERQTAYAELQAQAQVRGAPQQARNRAPRVRAPTSRPTLTTEQLERVLVARCGRAVDVNGDWIMEGAEKRAFCRRDVELELEGGR
jgi:hypothetical protein